MSQAGAIFKNTGLLLVSEIVNKGISFLILVLIARRLGEYGYGQYAYAFAFISLFVSFSNFGLDTFLLKELAKGKEQTLSLLGNALGLRVFTLVTSYSIALFIAIFILKIQALIWILALVMILEFFTALSSLITFLFKGHERNEYTVYALTIDKLLSLGGAIIAFGISNTLESLLLGLICAKVVSFAWHIFLTKKFFVPFTIQFDLKTWKAIMVKSVYFWISRTFQALFTQIDKVMLGTMAGVVVAGWYSTASTIIDGLFFIPVVIMFANFPVMTRLFGLSSHDELKKVYEKSLYLLLVVALPISIGLFTISERLVTFLYPGQFSESVIVLQILALGIAPLFVNYLIGFLLNAIDRQKVFMIIGGTVAALNILLNYLFIPRLEHKGAALAALITHLVNLVLIMWFSAKYGYKIRVSIITKPLLAAVAMGLVISRILTLPLMAVVAIGGVVYGSMLVLMKGLPKEELYLILKKFKLS